MTGRLRIFMGYAAGVGKTYRMLEEAQRRKAQGVDVAVGYFEPHGRRETIAKVEGLPVVPRARVEYRGSAFEEMDVDAVLERRPAVALVDEFPHTNVPGSRHEKRWQDVQELLGAGIEVWTTMNIQHLESLNDQVREITGVRVRETIPDWAVRQASEVVMVDVTPRALLHRMERGVVYAPDKAERAMEHFFREGTLAALRELALRETAHEAEERAERPGARERIVAFLTDDPAAAAVIRRAKRVADFLGAECFAVATETAHEAARETIERHLNFARNLRLETRLLDGPPAAAVLDFARRNGITHIYLARPRGRRFGWRRDVAQQIVDGGREMHAVIVSERRTDSRQA